MRLDDEAFDAAAQDDRLLEAFRRQVEHARRLVPFWRERLRGLDPSRIRSRADLALVPLLAKEELRALHPVELLGHEPPPIAISRWTSGTTGRPTISSWSDGDWAALVAVTARMLARHAPMARPVAFSAYSHGHLT